MGKFSCGVCACACVRACARGSVSCKSFIVTLIQRGCAWYVRTPEYGQCVMCSSPPNVWLSLPVLTSESLATWNSIVHKI